MTKPTAVLYRARLCPTGRDSDGRDLADVIAAHTGQDAEEIRRAAEEPDVQPLDEALEEAGILPTEE